MGKSRPDCRPGSGFPRICKLLSRAGTLRAQAAASLGISKVGYLPESG